MWKLVLAAIAAIACSSVAHAGVTEDDLAKDGRESLEVEFIDHVE